MELPYKGLTIYDKEPVKVGNRFSGESVMLSPEEVAVYDAIMGFEIVGEWEKMYDGIDWFRKNNPEAYMVLLD